jgi:hypothetical protein
LKVFFITSLYFNNLIVFIVNTCSITLTWWQNTEETPRKFNRQLFTALFLSSDVYMYDLSPLSTLDIIDINLTWMITAPSIDNHLTRAWTPHLLNFSSLAVCTREPINNQSQLILCNMTIRISHTCKHRKIKIRLWISTDLWRWKLQVIIFKTIIKYVAECLNNFYMNDTSSITVIYLI